MATKQKPNSVVYKNSRYLQGGLTSLNPSSLGWWERDIIPEAEDDITFTVTAEYANRPDQIASAVYDNPLLMWVVLQYNNILDVETELASGTVIKLPSRNRLISNIMSRPTGKTLSE